MLLYLHAAALENLTGQVLALSPTVAPDAVWVIKLIAADRTWLELSRAGGAVTDALGAIWPNIQGAVERRA